MSSLDILTHQQAPSGCTWICWLTAKINWKMRVLAGITITWRTIFFVIIREYLNNIIVTGYTPWNGCCMCTLGILHTVFAMFFDSQSSTSFKTSFLLLGRNLISCRMWLLPCMLEHRSTDRALPLWVWQCQVTTHNVFTPGCTVGTKNNFPLYACVVHKIK